MGRKRFRVEFLEDGVLLLDTDAGTVSRCTWDLVSEVRRGAASGFSPELDEALRHALRVSGAEGPRGRRDLLKAAGALGVVASSTLILPSAAQASSADLVAGSGWVTGSEMLEFTTPDGFSITTTRYLDGEDSTTGSEPDYVAVNNFQDSGGVYRAQVVASGVNGQAATDYLGTPYYGDGSTGMTIIGNLAISSFSSWASGNLYPAFGRGGTGAFGAGDGGGAAGVYLYDFSDTLWLLAAGGGGGAGASSDPAIPGGSGGRAWFTDGASGGDGGGITTGGGGARGTSPGAGGTGYNVGQTGDEGDAGTARAASPYGAYGLGLGNGGDGGLRAAAAGGGGGGGWAGGGGGGSQSGFGPSGGGGGGSTFVSGDPILSSYDRVVTGLPARSSPRVRVYLA